LTEVETRTEKRAAGATKLSKEEIKGKIIEYLWYLKKQGYADGSDGLEGTVEKRTKALKRLVDLGANLLDPENVKEVIATQKNWSDAYKVMMKYAYESFLQMEGMTWKPPRYKQSRNIPFVPLESEINRLINACGRKTSIFLQGLKETGADPGELWRLEWIDINEKTKTLTIRHPVKHHDPRILPISRELIERFQLLPKDSKKVFTMKMPTLRTNFSQQRNRIAREFNNPRLEKVTFTSLRHWKATTEYHRTKDILHVKQLLGHKNLSSTMKYIDIDRAVYGDHEDDEFVSRVARSLKGARLLIEAGFEYITDMDGYKLFRKRT